MDPEMVERILDGETELAYVVRGTYAPALSSNWDLSSIQREPKSLDIIICRFPGK
jgi:hypothetical protein